MPKLEEILSQEEKEKIIDLYESNVSIREIARKTGRDRAGISKMLESLGIKKTKGNHYRKYFFDFDFFEKIDSEKKAYWLGFLYADGCILSAGEYGEQCFKLQIAEQDKQSLIDFKEDIKSTYPIREDLSHYRKNPNHQKMVLICQTKQKTVDDLKKLGCVENKSLILKFPNKNQVPEKYIYDFIRGYFDGDGSISCDKNNHWTLSFVGTKDFIEELSKYFDGGSVFPDVRKENSWYYGLGGNLQLIKAYHLLYDNSTRYMQRKFDKFQKLLSKYSES